MSDTGGGYFIYPLQRQKFRANTVIRKSPVTNRPREQIIVDSRILPPTASAAASLRAGPVHSPSSPSSAFPPLPSHQVSRSTGTPLSHVFPLTPHPHMASYPLMDRYSRRDAYVTAAELHMEPRAYYSDHDSFTTPYPADSMDYRQDEPIIVCSQEGPFDQRFSSPSAHGSPVPLGSPSVAGSAMSEKTGDQPYAKLIFEALKGAPDHSMILREIYAWFEEHTDKPVRAPGGKQGWKNSIRHNLSMNEAFVKVAPASSQDREGNKGCIWKLSSKALADDCVLSTTRYRPKTANKRRSSNEILHHRQGNTGRVIKRSPPRDINVAQFDSMFGQPCLNDTQHQQSFNYHGSDTSMSFYPYSSVPALSNTSFTTGSNFTASYPSFASESNMLDNDMMGSDFGLCGCSGTPNSTISSHTDSLVADPFQDSTTGQAQADTFEVEGVSTRASGFNLFGDGDLSERKPSIIFDHSTADNIGAVTAACPSDISGIPMADTFSECNWQLDPFGHTENPDPQFY